MNIIDIDYNTLMIIVIALFALSGFFRGWWREGVSSIFLILLVVFLTQPELAQRIIDAINTLLKTIGIILEAGGSFDAQVLGTAAATAIPPIILDPTDRSIYIIALVIFALLSYFTGKYGLSDRLISPGARIIGGVLGAFNGFIAINLVKEYIVGRFFPETGISIQSAAPSTLSIAISDVPAGNIFADAPMFLVIGIGIVVVILVLTQRLTSKGRKIPWGYGREFILKPIQEKK